MAVPRLWSCTPSPRSFIICTHRTTCSVFTVHYSPSVSAGLPHLLHQGRGGEGTRRLFQSERGKKKKEEEEDCRGIRRTFGGKISKRASFSFVEQLRQDTPSLPSFHSHPQREHSTEDVLQEDVRLRGFDF